MEKTLTKTIQEYEDALQKVNEDVLHTLIETLTGKDKIELIDEIKVWLDYDTEVWITAVHEDYACIEGSDNNVIYFSELNINDRLAILNDLDLQFNYPGSH